MSETKRITLKTVNNGNDKSKAKCGSETKQKQTKRFVLRLEDECDECVEFSYAELNKQSVDNKRDQSNGANSGDDPYGDKDDESKLRQMERHYQEKYGPKKRKNWEDYVDKGMGYDETDPFIDNEEAYDELVPSTLTTQYGGFYINCGELEFRALSPDDNDDDDNIKPVLKRRRNIDSIKRRRSSKDELLMKSKKSKVVISGKTVAQMIQQKKMEKTPPNYNAGDEVIFNEVECGDSNSDLDVVPESVRDIIDSVAKGEDQQNGEERLVSSGSSDADDASYRVDPSAAAVKLPEGLPNDLNGVLENLKQFALASQDSKRNFFNNDINKMLLNIEILSREVSSSSRTQIYSYLASYLPCTRQTLMTKARKLMFESAEYGVQTAVAKITTIVKSVMPGIQKKYANVCEEVKLTFIRSKQMGLNVDQHEPKYPRRQFTWNDELIALLNEAVRYKINLYEQLGAKNQSMTLKEFVFDFLDDLKGIWPSGWMSRKALANQATWMNELMPAVPQTTATNLVQSVTITTTSTQSTTTNMLKHESDKMNKVSLTVTEKANKVSPVIVDKVNKVSPILAERAIKKDVSPLSVVDRVAKVLHSNETELTELKITNASSKPISNVTEQRIPLKMSDHEGLVSKFMPTVKETKDGANATNNNIVTVDLTTKSRSSPKLLTSSARLSPVNLKTSPTAASVVKSNTPSPSASPLAINSIMQSNKHEKMSGNSALQRIIEKSLGDYPNSSLGVSGQRLPRHSSSSLPHTTLPIEEMLTRNFNATALSNKDSKSEVSIELAPPSAESLKKLTQQQQQSVSLSHHYSHKSQQQPHHQQHQQHHHQHQQPQQQQKFLNKHISPTSTINFSRNPELVKKKAPAVQLPANYIQKEKTVDSLKRQSYQLSGQSLTQTSKNAANEALIITPVNTSTTNSANNGGSKSQSHPNQTSRYSNAASVITSTNSALNLQPITIHQLQANQINQFHLLNQIQMLNRPTIYGQNAALYTTANTQLQQMYFFNAANSTTPNNQTGSKSNLETN